MADDPMSDDRETATVTDGHSGDAESLASPLAAEIPTPEAVHDESDATGYVVWHREHLRTEDHLALDRALDDGDVVCPLFVFDPTFYGESGLACDARIRLLHEALTSLDRLYAAAPGESVTRTATQSAGRPADRSPLDTHGADGSTPNESGLDAVDLPAERGLTFGYGDPVELLSAFVERGWSVLTMAAPTSRYGNERDDRVRSACGDAVEFVSGDGLIRGAEWPREDWQEHVEEWLEAERHSPSWDGTVRLALDTGVTPAVVDDAFDIAPSKTKVPTGTHRAAATQLRGFIDRIGDYPGNISAPGDARGGTSGLSPYINFGLLSVRQVYQSVVEDAPSCRGREMFVSRLYWNRHYNQKLADWPGWTERAVNPALEGFNEDRHDPDLVEAWKRGETGFPMVDASMRCLRETGWLNFRMRAMCASFFAHVLQQPWWIGADWFHHHLIDSDVGINYTQWQSQAGLIGKPAQRVYNPRKQVRDQDPDGEWIARWVPELADLPSQFLDRPERTPIAVQQECGVTIGEDYPLPVVDFEARRETFWSRYERRHPEAASALARPEVARRASFSGGYSAARAIAEKHGEAATETDDGRQVSLGDVAGELGRNEETGGDEPAETPSAPGNSPTGRTETATDNGSTGDPSGPTATEAAETPIPRGAGERAGEPSPDDRAAAGDATGGDEHGRDDDDDDTGQATFERFD